MNIITIFHWLVALALLQETVIFFRMGVPLKKEEVRFTCNPFPFLKRLPRSVHNGVVYLLPVAAVFIATGPSPLATAGFFLAAMIVFYVCLFSFSSWHHGIFLLALLLFLLGMTFTFPATHPHPFIDLIRYQLVICYFFSGIAKLNAPLWNSTFLVDMLTASCKRYLPSSLMLNRLLAIVVVLLEGGLGILFLFTSPFWLMISILVGVFFHTATFVTTRKGNVFHYFTPLVYLLFVHTYALPTWIIPLILIPTIITILLIWAFYLREYVTPPSFPKKYPASTTLFFDGVCNLCNGFVQWVIKHDKNALITFAPLQGKTAHQLFIDPKAYNSLMLYHEKKYYTKSDAVIQLLKILGCRKLAFLLKCKPRFLRNIGYDLVARSRYGIFGRQKECMIPTKELRSRFLE